MRALWYERQGAARDVLEIGEMATPNAGEGEVRVEQGAGAEKSTYHYFDEARPQCLRGKLSCLSCDGISCSRSF